MCPATGRQLYGRDTVRQLLNLLGQSVIPLRKVQEFPP